MTTLGKRPFRDMTTHLSLMGLIHRFVFIRLFQQLFKRCSTCKHVKLRTAFSNDRGKKDGKQTKCKSCEKEYGAKRRVKDKDKIRAEKRANKKKEEGNMRREQGVKRKREGEEEGREKKTKKSKRRGATDQVELVFLQEGFHDVSAEGEAHATVVLAPAFTISSLWLVTAPPNSGSPRRDLAIPRGGSSQGRYLRKLHFRECTTALRRRKNPTSPISGKK